jgi:hypothetical protein
MFYFKISPRCTGVPLVAHNHEIASSIPAGNATKLENKKIKYSSWLNMANESGAIKED